ncbi:hypothetical protein ABIF38_004304 [Bradyrhizobium japonicum]|jgi:hypothetical protein|uniref:DUF6894 domain-containing protein n=1 Tax=Bradyrhizobium elkanii TaxID=29448 RepID=A0ABV4F7H3_BRAEL|nr:hypothetical protein [Bradyrhizobium elkanii]MCP1733381.1 hypothetical protein [Bradyrhizobium elkanii]MCP1750988.1 hypothetical protein [Bradyrhizobium elkanii]MCP1976760.1 hypothetical protein [Bradyrhizobium elkanii]MCS3523843.1 hypothetical protein [Bradyrhizobium elkanii]MCS3568719.1 hypothetical protein [Bradyrhizobium elkanii]
MIRYDFDIREHSGIYPDEEGMEFATQREAEVEAAESLAGLARDLATLDDRPDLSVEVRTVVGRVFQAALIFDRSETKQ